MRAVIFTAALSLLLLPVPAEAYIGPSVSAGVISVVLGIIAAVCMALIAILWYPFKRLLKRMKRAPGSAPAGEPAALPAHRDER